MSAGDMKVIGDVLYQETADAGLRPIAQVVGNNHSLIKSLTVIHAVCKDTDIDVMREMQSAGLTFKKAWRQAVMNTTASIIAETLGIEVEAIPVSQEVLNELEGMANETKH